MTTWTRLDAAHIDAQFADLIRSLGGDPDARPPWTRADDFEGPDPDDGPIHECRPGCACDVRADVEDERRWAS